MGTIRIFCVLPWFFCMLHWKISFVLSSFGEFLLRNRKPSNQ